MAKSIKEKLAEKARIKEESSAAKKKNNFIVNLTGSVSEEGDKLCAAHHAKENIIAYEKRARAVLMNPLQNIIFAEWIKNGKRLDSPVFNTETGSHFSLQCRDTVSKFKIRPDQGKSLDEHLHNQDVPEDLIESVKDEFTEDLIVTVDLPKLEKNKPHLADAIMELINAACEDGVTIMVENDDGEKVEKVIKFNKEESELILEQVIQVRVKEGFLDRTINYAKTESDSLDQSVSRLASLLQAVPPTWAIAQVHCANPQAAINDLIKNPPEEEEVPQTPIEYKAKDNSYIFRVESNLLTILTPKGKKVAEKKCKDHKHAKNSAMKFVENPDSLKAYLLENLSK